MTRVKFLADENGVYGFEISGHSTSDCDDSEGKIVCAAISSAAYMAANTVTDVIGDECEIVCNEGEMCLAAKHPCAASRAVLEGFKLHAEQLSVQYKNNIRIIGDIKF